MNDYIRRNLGSNEKVIMEAKHNKLSIIPEIINIVLGIILFFVLRVGLSKLNGFIVAQEGERAAMPDYVEQIFMVIFAVICAAIIIMNVLQIISCLNSALVITNKRVLGKTGVFSIKALDYPIEKIDNVSLNAGLFGRIFKYYDLSVKTAGDNNMQGGGIKFSGIKNAVEFKNHITLAIEKHSEEARKQQAMEIAKAMSNKR